MNKYRIVIYDDFFKKEFTGDFGAEDQETAIEEAKEYYAFELDTQPNEIDVRSITELC